MNRDKLWNECGVSSDVITFAGICELRQEARFEAATKTHHSNNVRTAANKNSGLIHCGKCSV